MAVTGLSAGRLRDRPHGRQPAGVPAARAKINALRRAAARHRRELLWVARLVLLAALVLHVVAAIQLTLPEPGGAPGRRTRQA